MGAFLDKPVTDKEKYCDEAWQNNMRACVAAMQGWRVGMEVFLKSVYSTRMLTLF